MSPNFFFGFFLCACVAFDWTLIDQKGRGKKKKRVAAAKMCFLKTIKNLIFVATRLESKRKTRFCTVWTRLASGKKQRKVA